MISRRRFLTAGAIALAPLGAAAHAQQYKAQQAGQREPHIGILTPQKLSDSNLPDFWGAFRQGFPPPSLLQRADQVIE